MLPSPESLKETLQAQLPGIGLSIEGEGFGVEVKDWVSVCRYLKTAPALELDYLSDLTAVDYPPDRIEVVCHLYSMKQKHGPLTLRVKLNRAHPVVDSVTAVWRSAEFQEREVYDLFGVTFTHHPDLRRILMWDGFEGYPMRKDYVVEDQDVLEKPA